MKYIAAYLSSRNGLMHSMFSVVQCNWLITVVVNTNLIY